MDNALVILILDLHCHSWKERQRPVPPDSLISGIGRMIVIVVIVAQKGNSSPFGLQSAHKYAHTQTNTALSTCIIVLIREDNGWLLTRKGLIAFKLTFFAAKISLLNLIWILYEKLSLAFWDSSVLIFLRFLATLCRFLCLRKTAKKYILYWPSSSDWYQVRNLWLDKGNNGRKMLGTWMDFVPWWFHYCAICWFSGVKYCI